MALTLALRALRVGRMDEWLVEWSHDFHMESDGGSEKNSG